MAKKHIQVIGDFFRETFNLKINTVYSIGNKVFWIDSEGYIYMNSLETWKRAVQKSFQTGEEFTGTIADKEDIMQLVLARIGLEHGGFLYEGEFSEE